MEFKCVWPCWPAAQVWAAELATIAKAIHLYTCTLSHTSVCTHQTSPLIIFSNGFSFHVFINFSTSSINDDALLPDTLPPSLLQPLQPQEVQAFVLDKVKVLHALSLQLKLQNNAGAGQRYQDSVRFSVPLSSVCRRKSTESSWSRGRSSWRLTQQRSQLPPPLLKQARRNEDLRQQQPFCVSVWDE